MNLNLARPLCVFDIESTGTDVALDRIVTLAIVKHFPDDEFLDPAEFTLICDPVIRIPAEATEVHGITNEDVKGRPLFSIYAPAVMEFIKGCDLAGFNCLNFDVPLLYEEFARAGLTWDLTGVNIVDCGNIFKLKEKRTLEAACVFYNAPVLENAHNALADTIATGHVLIGQLSRYADLQSKSIAELAEFCKFEQRVDLAGKLVRNKAGEIIYNIGAAKGKRVMDDTGFGSWMLQRDFTQQTKDTVRKVLKGELI